MNWRWQKLICVSLVQFTDRSFFSLWHLISSSTTRIRSTLQLSFLLFLLSLFPFSVFSWWKEKRKLSNWKILLKEERGIVSFKMGQISLCDLLFLPPSSLVIFLPPSISFLFLFCSSQSLLLIILSDQVGYDKESEKWPPPSLESSSLSSFSLSLSALSLSSSVFSKEVVSDHGSLIIVPIAPEQRAVIIRVIPLPHPLSLSQISHSDFISFQHIFLPLIFSFSFSRYTFRSLFLVVNVAPDFKFYQQNTMVWSSLSLSLSWSDHSFYFYPHRWLIHHRVILLLTSSSFIRSFHFFFCTSFLLHSQRESIFFSLHP